MKSHEATGRTVEEAISAGLETLGMSIGDVTVDILQEGSKGLFGLFGSRQAKVRLTIKEQETIRDTQSIFANSLSTARPAPRTEPAPPPRPRAPRAPESAPKEPRPPKSLKASATPTAEEPASESATRKRSPRRRQAAQGEPRPARAAVPAAPVIPATPAEPGTIAADAQGFLEQLTQLMGIPVAVAVATDEEGNIRADLSGDAQGVLIGRRGETLDALQYLTSLKINRGKDQYVRLTLDSEGYRAKREEALVRLANRMANRARKTGRRVALEPMNPYERRVLHSALQGREDVSTHSEGEEPNRHVVITVNKNAARPPEDAVDTSSAANEQGDE